MRRGVYAAIPWFALILVAIVLFRELGSRRATPTRATTDVPHEARRDAEGNVEVVSPLLVARAEAAEADAQRAQAETARAAADLAVSRDLRSRAEAARAAAEARVSALQAELDALKKEHEVARERTSSLERDLAQARDAANRAEDPVDRLLEEAAQTPDRQHLAALRVAAAALAEEDVERLARRLEAEPALAARIVKLVEAMSDQPTTRRLVVTLLRHPEAESDAATYVAATASHLASAETLAEVLGTAGPVVRREILARMSSRAEPWSDEDRERLARVLLPLLKEGSPESRALAARGVAVLRLAGAAETLESLLASPDADVRASAAHALSRVPDLASVRESVRLRIPALLEDPSLAVRTGGLLLAEAWLGEPVEFDAAAPEAARRPSLEKLRARLSL